MVFVQRRINLISVPTVSMSMHVQLYMHILFYNKFFLCLYSLPQDSFFLKFIHSTFHGTLN
jgi:hypothetical protein